MNNKGGLPIPFLILILAGVVSLFSLIATSTSPARMVRDNSPHMQMVEQERMAALYFRVLSWLSDITPRTADAPKANRQPAAVPQGGKAPQPAAHQSPIELCTFHSAQSPAIADDGAHHIN